MAAIYGQARERELLAIFGGVGITFGIHIVTLVALILFRMHGAQTTAELLEEEIAPFTPVELVRLGEPPKPNAMPRIANPEKEVEIEDVVNLAKPDPNKVVLEKKEEPKDKKKEKVERKKKKLDILKGFHNPNRPTNDDTPEGQSFGVVGGTTSDAAMKHLMNTYAAKLMQQFNRYWRVPSAIGASEAKKLAGKVRVSVRLSPDGHVVSYSMRAKSENGQFNISIERAIKTFMIRYGGQKLPMPADESVKALVIEKGLNLRGWRYTGR